MDDRKSHAHPDVTSLSETSEILKNHFGFANSATTATVATTVCINTSNACALGVTPANRCDLVKLTGKWFNMWLCRQTPITK
jgi:hypothetical protein